MINKKFTLAAGALVLATNTNASVIHTLDGVSYEWLELTVTAGQSRAQVEASLAAATPGDILYGYEYASRILVEELFLSYNSWDGIGGWHSMPATLTGVDALFYDFGQLGSDVRSGTLSTVDGGSARYNHSDFSDGLHGLDGECGTNKSCRAVINKLAFFDTTKASYMVGAHGYDSLMLNPATRGNDYISSSTGSFLVRTAVVPIPSAAWLFITGIVGIIGFASKNITSSSNGRKKHAA